MFNNRGLKKEVESEGSDLGLLHGGVGCLSAIFSRREYVLLEIHRVGHDILNRKDGKELCLYGWNEPAGENRGHPYPVEEGHGDQELSPVAYDSCLHTSSSSLCQSPCVPGNLKRSAQASSFFSVLEVLFLLSYNASSSSLLHWSSYHI